MTMWRIERVERTPHNDPDPATAAFRITVRDADTGAQEIYPLASPINTLSDPNAMTNQVCNHWNGSHVPNDLNCT